MSVRSVSEPDLTYLAAQNSYIGQIWQSFKLFP
jgi:hypothetical protein